MVVTFFFNLFSNNSSMVLNLPDTPPIKVNGKYTTDKIKAIEKTAEKENIVVVPQSHPNICMINRIDIAVIGKSADVINKFRSQLFPPKNL